MDGKNLPRVQACGHGEWIASYDLSKNPTHQDVKITIKCKEAPGPLVALVAAHTREQLELKVWEH